MELAEEAHPAAVGKEFLLTILTLA